MVISCFLSFQLLIMSLDQGIEAGKTGRKQPKPCYLTAVELLEKKLEKLDHLLLVSILYATGVLLDFLLVYTVKINDARKCVQLDKSLGYTAFGFRSLLEILNGIVFCKNFKNFKSRLLKNGKDIKFMTRILLGIAITREEFQDFLIFHQILSLILVAVGWQVMLMISLIKYSSFMYIALNYLLALHLPRVLVVIAILLKRQKTSSSRFRTKLARLFFFFYIYSIQLFAALWYLPAIYNESRCWKEAYKNQPGQKYGYSAFNCTEKSQDEVNFIRDYCSTKNSYDVFNCTVMSPEEKNLSGNVRVNCSTNAARYEFGIYSHVHQAGILGTENSLLLILYFSRWALQCLSSFAQDLEAGVNVWQNFFIIFIIVYAVFMFFFLIGELQSEWERFAKLKPKLREKKQWMATKEISEDIQSQIRRNERDNWPETKEVNIENIFSSLPRNVSWKLSQQLCLERLKKVKEFGGCTEESLKELCDRVKPVFYEKRAEVIKKGDPVNEMLFVVQGELWTYPSRSQTIDSGSTGSCNDNENDLMRPGDFYGEELVKLVRANPCSYDFPKSTVTIQAVTNVEAFVLMAYDLKKIFVKQSRESLALENQSPIPTQEADTTSTVSAVAVCADCGLTSLLADKSSACLCCVIRNLRHDITSQKNQLN